jgi:hypothetical protein
VLAVARVALVDEQVFVHVFEGHVVLRVLRRLPYVAGGRGVQHGLAAEEGPDAPRHRFDVAFGDDHLRVVAHGITLVPTGARVVTRRGA